MIHHQIHKIKCLKSYSHMRIKGSIEGTKSHKINLAYDCSEYWHKKFHTHKKQKLKLMIIL